MKDLIQAVKQANPSNNRLEIYVENSKVWLDSEDQDLQNAFIDLSVAVRDEYECEGAEEIHRMLLGTGLFHQR